MSAAKHTSPFMAGWETTHLQSSDGVEYYEISAPILGKEIGTVADTLNCHHCLTIEDQEKIARLIAAAPELLETLVLAEKELAEAESVLTSLNRSGLSGSFGERVVSDSLPKIRAAIAKVRP